MALTPPPSDSHQPHTATVAPRGRPWWRHWQVIFLILFVPVLMGQEEEQCSAQLTPQFSPTRFSVLGVGNMYSTDFFNNLELICQSGQTCTFQDPIFNSVTVAGDQPAGSGGFVSWESDSILNDPTDEEITSFVQGGRYTALFCAYHDLNLAIAGDNGGLIQLTTDPLTAIVHTNIIGVPVGVPRGIATLGGTDASCGINGCRVQACVNTTVTLTPQPLSGFFTGWSGDPDCADGVVTLDGNGGIDGNKSCTATFDYPDLTVTITGNGRVFGSNGNCTAADSPCTTELPLGTEASLVADPNIGAEFLGWGGDCVESLFGPLLSTLLIDDNRTCTAEFQGGITVGDPGTIELVSEGDGGEDLVYPINYAFTSNSIGGVDISGDGRVAVFRGRFFGSAGTDPHHYFARYPMTNRTVDVALDGTVAASINQLSVSADGRYVAFDSNDPSLPINDGGGAFIPTRVFVKDLVTNTVVPVSVDDVANEIEVRDQAGYQAAVSGNGRYVVFSARLVRRPLPPPALPILENNWTVLVRDTCAGVVNCTPSTHVISVNDEGIRPIDPNTQSLVAINPTISADGRFVAFLSSSRLLAGFPPGDVIRRQVFLHDRDVDEDGIFDETPPADCSDTDSCPISTRLISDFSVGVDQTLNADYPVISANGRYIVYKHKDTLLAPIYGTSILLYDSCFGAPEGTCNPTIVGVPATGTSNDESDDTPDISGDGRFISMSGNISNTYGAMVRDTCIGAPAGCSPETRLVSLNQFGNPAHGGTARISVDGRAIVFASDTTNLLPVGTGTPPDIFLAQSGFTVTPGEQPTLDRFLPASDNRVPTSPGQRLFTLEGEGFVPGATVLLNGLPHPTIYVSSTRIQFRAAEGVLGSATSFDVQVANPGVDISEPLTLTVKP